MAKLTGPEEFFEVFRHDKDQPAPAKKPESQPVEQPQIQPAADAGLAARPGSEKTIPVKPSTLAFAGVCVVLLMILSYVAGQANAPDKQPAGQTGTPQKQKPPVPPLSALGDAGTRQTGGVTPQSQRHQLQARGVELRVIKYPNDAGGESAALAAINFIKTQEAIRRNAVSVGSYKDGNLIIVAVKPFESDRSPAAVEVWKALEDATYLGMKRFKKTLEFGPIHQDR